MAVIKIRREHQMSADEVRGAVDRLAQQLTEQFDAEYRWDADQLLFERTGAHGHIHVEDNAVQIELTLSFMLRPLKGRIEQEMTRYLEDVLRG